MLTILEQIFEHLNKVPFACLFHHSPESFFAVSLKGNVRAFNPISLEIGDSPKSQAHEKLSIFNSQFSEVCGLKANKRSDQHLICFTESSWRSLLALAGFSCGSSFFFRVFFQLLDRRELLERFSNSDGILVGFKHRRILLPTKRSTIVCGLRGQNSMMWSGR